MIPQKPSRDPLTLSVLSVGAVDPLELRALDPMILMPIESSIVRVATGTKEIVLDRSGFLVVPRKARVRVRASTMSVRVAAITFHEPVLAGVARAYKKLGLERAKLEKWLLRIAQLPRTVWVHEIVHRYVFERHALGERNNAATRFLEIEILKEIYFLFRDRDEGVDRSHILHKHSAPVEKAVSFVEAHLFEPCNIAALARHAGASESTLLRAFRRELGCTPGTYWRRRKHDEALELLRAGRYSVAQIAERVGYDNPTAFGHAFRLRFGRPPSSFIPRKPQRPAP